MAKRKRDEHSGAGSAAGGSSGSSTVAVAAAAVPTPTAFQQRLYALLKLVPRGRVTSYQALATVLGSSARAVGQGMRRNPFAPIVPCHRVIAASLDLGGFNGQWGGAECSEVMRKKGMLEEEGVRFSGLKLASSAFFMGPDELAAAAKAASLRVTK